MTVSSMTGFARADGAHHGRRWLWEARSVNGRGLETRFRIPPGFDALEPDLRRIAAEHFSRGSLNASLTLDKSPSAGVPKVNAAALEETLRLVAAVRGKIDCDPPRAEGILAIRGVVEADDGGDSEGERAQLAAALIEGFRQAAMRLKTSRRTEGDHLKSVLAAQIDEIARLVTAARTHAEASPAAIRARVAGQLKELIEGGVIQEERLAQEAALIALKADIREELDRLAAHIDSGRALLAAAEPVGRRLDFLTQELNREANTLCAKAQEMSLKRLGLDLKMVIDQLREQVQNIE